MTRDHGVLGEETSNRLLERVDRNSLSKEAMPGGGEFYRGAAADGALQALGARAMTVDDAIVVGQDFDPSRAADRALFAHEQHHLEHSGGEGGDSLRDAEEIAARSVERMVLQQGASTGPESVTPLPSTEKPKPKSAYGALRAQGLDHAAVVDKLAREVVAALDERRALEIERCHERGAW
jgi:Domain of unknown function (DUF4157)